MINTLNKIGYISLLILLGVVSTSAQITSKTAVNIDVKARYMYYFVEEGGKQLLYSANKKDGIWGSGTEVTSFNKYLTEGEFRSPFICADGNSLYYSAKLAGSNSFDLYVAHKKGNEWQAPQKLPLPISSNDNEENPSITGNNRVLYFTRRPNTDVLGECKTIYRSTLLETGLWSKPEPLMLPIGTGCEDSPQISTDGNILYFASDRPSIKKKKKFNIYYSKRYDNNVWSIPLPIDNTEREYNEFFPTVDYASSDLHFTRVMPESQTADLYSVKLEKEQISENFFLVEGVIREDSKGVNAKIYVRNAFNGDIEGVSESDEQTGEYLLVVPKDGNYTMEVRRHYCSPYYSPLVISDQQQNLTKDIDLFRLVNVSLKVFDAEQMIPTDAKVTISSGAASQFKWGEYLARLPLNKTYDFTITKPGYTTESLKVNLSDEMFFENLEYIILLKPDLSLCEIKINDALLNKPMSAMVEVKDVKKDETIEVTETRKGFYTVNIHKNRTYSMSIFAPEHMFFYAKWSLDGARVKQSMNVSLAPIKQGSRFPLQGLEFKATKDTWTTESEEELNCLARLLKDNPNLSCTFFLQAQENESDKKLAAKREGKLKTFFENREVEASRISAVHEVRKNAKNTFPEVQFN